MPRQFDPWMILEVSRNATDDEIKKAFRKMARLYHPDTNKKPDATTKFQEITRAYEAIRSASRRAEWLDKTGGTGGAPSGASQQARTTSAAQQEEITISFAEAYSGKTHATSVIVDARCPRCNGSGCASCGNGSVRQRHPIRVNIPPGSSDGQQLRVTTRGLPELVLTIRVKESRVFKRLDDPADLLMIVPITFAEACLGTSVHLPTPSKAVALKIPPGTQVGKTFRVASHGMPRFGTGNDEKPMEFGDLYVRVSILVPAETTPQQKKLIQQLAMLDPKNVREKLISDLGKED